MLFRSNKMKVLLAVDDSNASSQAVKYLAKLLKPDDLVLMVAVVEEPSVWNSPIDTTSFMEILNDLKDYMKDVMKDYGKIFAESNIPFQRMIGTGHVGEVICDQAEELLVDLVVTGRRHLGAVPRVVFGSESSYILHHSPCSVLVIRSHEEPKPKKKKAPETVGEVVHIPNFYTL